MQKPTHLRPYLNKKGNIFRCKEHLHWKWKKWHNLLQSSSSPHTTHPSCVSAIFLNELWKDWHNKSWNPKGYIIRSLITLQWFSNYEEQAPVSLNFWPVPLSWLPNPNHVFIQYTACYYENLFTAKILSARCFR